MFNSGTYRKVGSVGEFRHLPRRYAVVYIGEYCVRTVCYVSVYGVRARIIHIYLFGSANYKYVYFKHRKAGCTGSAF